MEPLFLIPEQTLGQTCLCIVRLCVKCAELSTHQNNHVLCSDYLILTSFVLCILLVCFQSFYYLWINRVHCILFRLRVTEYYQCIFSVLVTWPLWFIHCNVIIYMTMILYSFFSFLFKLYALNTKFITKWTH